MTFDGWIVVVIVAFLIGWLFGYGNQKKQNKPVKNQPLPQNYLIGLNFLLNEQPDKAVDIFIDLLKVDSDTIETHLALGNLFRRRGEVDRAIRIHQNLIARPNLSKQERRQSLLALGQDYLSAGVLDRAERVFKEVVENHQNDVVSLQCLLDIYQQEKDWHKAMRAARQIEMISNERMHQVIAHHYCELAEQTIKAGQNEQALLYLKEAILVDKFCVRASLLKGRLECGHGHYKSALKTLQRIGSQDPLMLSEAIAPIAHCYEQMDARDQLITYLQQCLKEFANLPIALVIADYLKKYDQDNLAQDFVIHHVRSHATLWGLKVLVNLQLATKEHSEALLLFNDILTQLVRDLANYRCEYCGFAVKTLHWCCPGCKHWGSIKPIYGTTEK